MGLAPRAAAAEQAPADGMRRADRRAARLSRAVRAARAERADRRSRARAACRVVCGRYALAASKRGSAARVIRARAVDRTRALRIASLVAALAGLDFALTFAHVWPTFAIRPAAAVSIEILAVVAAVLLLGALGRAPGRRAAAVLALVLTVMAVGRYAAVTTAGLYGRPVHLYFDLPHVPNVCAMRAKVASPWLLAAGGVLAALIVAGVFAALRAALVRVSAAAARPAERAGVAAACVVAAVL